MCIGIPVELKPCCVDNPLRVTHKNICRDVAAKQ